MKDKIFNVSNIIVEARSKYGEFARKKVIVDYGNAKGRGKREEYLDDPRTNIDINTFLNHSKAKRLAIHLDCLGRTWKNRLLWNAIMLIFEAAAFFGIPGLGKILVNGLAFNSSVMGVLSTYLITIVCGSLLYYVNQKKFYYNEKELERLNQVKSDIDRANNILASIVAYKEKEFDNSRERSKIDYQDTIIKNHNRNVDIFFERQKYEREARERINTGVERTLHQTPLGKVGLYVYDDYPNVQITREGKYTRVVKKDNIMQDEYERRRKR